MIPFRAYDRENQQMWQIINFHPASDGNGHYLATREDDSEADGEIRILAIDELTKLKFIEFIEEPDQGLE